MQRGGENPERGRRTLRRRCSSDDVVGLCKPGAGETEEDDGEQTETGREYAEAQPVNHPGRPFPVVRLRDLVVVAAHAPRHVTQFLQQRRQFRHRLRV